MFYENSQINSLWMISHIDLLCSSFIFSRIFFRIQFVLNIFEHCNIIGNILLNKYRLLFYYLSRKGNSNFLCSSVWLRRRFYRLCVACLMIQWSKSSDAEGDIGDDFDEWETMCDSTSSFHQSDSPCSLLGVIQSSVNPLDTRPTFYLNP